MDSIEFFFGVRAVDNINFRNYLGTHAIARNQVMVDIICTLTQEVNGPMPETNFQIIFVTITKDVIRNDVIGFFFNFYSEFRG